MLEWFRHDSALSRLRNPQTWWRTIEVELANAQLTAIRGGNWQRGGGQGQQPESVLGPWPTSQGDETATSSKPKMTPTEIRDELAKRRALRQAQAG